MKQIFGLATVLTALSVPSPAPADQTLRVAVVDPPGFEKSAALLQDISDIVRGALARMRIEDSPLLVLAREKTRAVMAANRQALPPGCPRDCELAIGRLLEVDVVVSWSLRPEKTEAQGPEREVIVRAYDVPKEAFRGLGIARGKNASDFASSVPAAVEQALGTVQAAREPPPRVLAEAPIEAELQTQPEPDTEENGSPVTVRFLSDPPGAAVRVDGAYECATTPCRAQLYPGEHTVTLTLENYERYEKDIVIEDAVTVRAPLQPAPYSYFGMNGVENVGHIVTVGLGADPDTNKKVSVLDGFHLAGWARYVDFGFGGGIFSYNRNARGSSWSIFGFGPAIKLGRLYLFSKLELLSFRHDNTADSNRGWLPGVSSRALLPIVSRREIGGWATLVPVPVAGLDVWFDKRLGHDHTGFWFGLSWLGRFAS